MSFGADVALGTTSTARIYNQVEISYIQGLNCDTFTEAAAKTRCLEIKKQVAIQSPVTGMGPVLPPPPPPARTESGSDDRRPPMPPMESQTGSDNHHMMPPPVSQSGTTMPMPKPPMGSGAEMNNPGQGLMLAIGKLSPTDRETLVKMIREYLTSKGIDLAQFAEKREEIKDIKKETRETIKDIVKTNQNTIKNTIKTKREEMRSQIREIRQGSESGSTK
jgi:hypothetical protein